MLLVLDSKTLALLLKASFEGPTRLLDLLLLPLDALALLLLALHLETLDLELGLATLELLVIPHRAEQRSHLDKESPPLPLLERNVQPRITLHDLDRLATTEILLGASFDDEAPTARLELSKDVGEVDVQTLLERGEDSRLEEYLGETDLVEEALLQSEFAEDTLARLASCDESRAAL